MPEPEIREFGPDVIWGLPVDQKMKMVITYHRSTKILEEADPIGAQHLKSEDIIYELEKLPNCLRERIALIVLSPFDKIDCFADSNDLSAQITIYAKNENRDFLRKRLSKHLTLCHEAGHMFDGNIRGPNNFYSTGMEWQEAMCLDTKTKRDRTDLPEYYVSDYAEHTRKTIGKGRALLEDFADSVMYFSDESGYKEFLKENFPNRFGILEDLLK